MGISAGDAIFNFFGDATQLDQTWSKVEADANAKAPVVQQQVNSIGQSWEQTGQAAAGAAQQTTQAAEQITTAAQGAAGASAEAAQTASPEWLALAKATDTATRATIEHEIAQKQLEAAIAAAAKAEQGDQTTLVALAAAEERVATTATVMAAAQKEVEVASQAATLSIRSEAEAALQSEVALKSAADAALTFGINSKIGAEEAAFSMQEAKGSIALVGEEIGVNVPRHLRGFIAEIPGVGAALEAAFSGIAIIVLIQLLVEATEKLTELVSETFIYTEAMKEEYKAQVELNKEIEKSADNVKKLKEAYETIGASPVEKDIIEFQRLDKQVEDTKRTIESYQNLITLANTRGFDSNGNPISDVQVEEAGRNIAKLQAQLKEFEQERANILKQGNVDALAEQIRAGEAEVNADKTRQEARIELARAESELRLTLAKAGYSSLIEAQQAFDEQTYQVRLHALQQTVGLLAQDPTRNADRIKELNAQIEALEDAHQAKLIQIRLKGVQALQAAIKAALSQTTSTPVDDIVALPSEVNERVQQISDILAQFGIKSGQIWQEEVDATDAAIRKVAELGDALGDLSYEMLQLAEKNLTAKIGLAIDRGDIQLAEQYKDELAGIRVQLDELGNSEDKEAAKSERLNRARNTTVHLIDEWANTLRKDQSEMTKTQKVFDDVLTDTSAAFGNAVAQWALSQDSLGHALRRGLAEEAAVIAGKAAMWGLYFTAWGIADLFWNPARAGADFASAAEFFAVAALAGAAAYGLNPDRGGRGDGTQGAPNGTQPIETTPVSETQAAPTQTTQVQRFAGGGFVSGPTMAIIGDSVNSANQAALSGPGQQEAVIPIDDDRATNPLAQAIVKHMANASSGDRVVVELHGDLVHLIRKVNKRVQKGGVQLTSTNSLATRRKS